MTTLPTRQRGSILVEASFLMVFFLILFFGTIDMSRAINVLMDLHQAVYAGAIYGASGHSTDNNGMTNVAKADARYASVSTFTANLYCACSTGGTLKSCTNPGCGGTVYQYVEVSGSTSFNTLFPYGVIPRTFNFNANCSLRIQ